jgi:hypothetical protein
MLRTAGLKLTEKKQGQLSGDPAGYTASGAEGGVAPRFLTVSALTLHTHPYHAADVLYGGSVGHIIGVGIVLGLRATGGL